MPTIGIKIYCPTQLKRGKVGDLGVCIIFDDAVPPREITLDPSELFFVLGAAKSGTTWLQKLLDCHPDILCTGEGGFHTFIDPLTSALQRYTDDLNNRQAVFGEQTFVPLEADEADDLIANFIVRRFQAALATHEGPEPRHIGNKDPDHGTNIELMARLFPQARYIHIIRDGRDRVVSAWHWLAPRRERLKAMASPKAPYFKTIHEMANDFAPKWAHYIRNIRQTAADAGLAYHELRYEDLVNRPEETFGAVLEFLGAEAGRETTASCLSEASFDRLKKKPRATDQTNTADPSRLAAPLYRNGRIGDWRHHFSEADSRRFADATDGLMDELGYH